MSSTTPGSDPERREPVEGGPLESAPPPTDASEPAPVASEPAPVVSEPVASEPVEPEPVEPEPVEPAPVASEPYAHEPESAGAEPASEPPTVPEPRDDTARLDEAVQRANAEPAASDTEDDGVDDTREAAGVVPEPVPMQAARRETYVPAATVVTGTAAGAATLAPEPELAPPPAPAPQTIYVQAPAPPRVRSNRGFGMLVAVVGTVLFALLYAGVAYLLLTIYGAGRAGDSVATFVQFLASPVYWVPIVAFLVGFAVLILIVNRGPWWAYAVFGLVVGAFVYFAYIGGALLTVQAWTLTLDDARTFLGQRWLDPFAITAFIVAREIPVWLGGWLAARGRTVTERNRVAREEYDRQLAAGPQPQRT